MPAKAPTTRYEFEKRQAKENAQLVAAAIESRKLGFLNDQPGPAPQPQSLAGRPYTAFNAIVTEALAARLNSDSMQFGSAGQFRDAGYRPRRGETGVSMVGTSTKKFQVVRDGSGLPVINDDGRIKRELVDRARPRPETYTVYHASQVEAMGDGTPPLPALQRAKRAVQPLEMALELAEQLGCKIRRTDTRFTRGGSGGITMPSSEAIGNDLDEAREIIGGLSGWMQESGSLRSGSYDFAWKDPLVKALAAHRAGQQLGIGSRTLAFTEKHLGNIARGMRRRPERMVSVARDAGERSDYLCRDAEARKKLRGLSEARAKRHARRRNSPNRARRPQARGR